MESHLISINSSLREALEALNRLSGKVMTLLVLDDDGRLCGTLTDGDTRRALLRGVGLDDTLAGAMHRDFKCLHENDFDVEAVRAYRQFGIRLMPVVDSEGRPTRLIDLTKTHNVLPISAILMAGGKGERLRPLTLDTPKPLLKIDGTPIIDFNIQALAAAGVTDITVTTNYLAEKIHEHFAQPVAGVQVKCVRESRPLGTIGAASLVELPSEGDTLIMNSDLLTSISFEDFYLHHSEHEADITIAAIPYVVSIPYAILESDGDNVTALSEKPTFTYRANAGIYLVNNRLLRTLTPDVRIDATEFIERAIDGGARVNYFPLTGTWIDIGNPADFRQAQDLMRHHRNFTR